MCADMLTIQHSADKECVQLLLTVNGRRCSDTTDGLSMRIMGIMASIPVGELLIHFDRSCLVEICSPKDEPFCILCKRYSTAVTGLEWPRGFQEVKVPRFRDNGTRWW
jgi:hypothetical protein